MHDEYILDDEPSVKPRTPPLAHATKAGLLIPALVVKRALGANWRAFLEAPNLCVVIKVKTAEWVSPVLGACRVMTDWKFEIDGEQSSRTNSKLAAEAAVYLARGKRVLCVFTRTAKIPKDLLDLADMVIDVDHISTSDISTAVRLVTGKRPRHLLTSVPPDLDMVQAMAAIRQGSSPAECMRRLNASEQPVAEDPTVTSAPRLGELHGYGDAMTWAVRLVGDLERWRAGEIGLSSIQRNAVLGGPPGVGKSTFVRSLAKSAGVPLVVSSVGKMFGTSAGYLDSIIKSIDRLFAEARAAGPCCIVLIEELEAIPNRAALSGREGSWWTPVVNHMLTTLDDALSEAAGALIVVGTTNHANMLDPALVRPGRMDRIISIGPPSVSDLAMIYRQHLGDDLPGEKLEAVAMSAAGATGADVVGHVKGARARARQENRPLRMSDLVEEIQPPSDDDVNLRLFCVHEAGHAVVASVLKTARIVSVVVGKDTFGRGGHVEYDIRPGALRGTGDFEKSIMQVLGGRAAEEVILGFVSGGSGGGTGSDLAKATTLLATARFSLGLGDGLAYRSTPDRALVTAMGDNETLRSIEAQLGELYGRALDIIRANADAVLVLAETLGEERVMSGARVEQLLSPFLRSGDFAK